MTAQDGLLPLREVIRQAGLSAKKSLGQNFLLISTGPGASPAPRAPRRRECGRGRSRSRRPHARALMEGAAKVVVIERDERCIPPLEEIAAAYPGRLEIVSADAREIDYAALPIRGPARLVANLPYSVGTPLLVGWLKTEPWPPWFDSLVLMFQREVAERIVAVPGGKDYGRLAVLAQWRTEPRILFSLPPDAFTPKPKVASAVVKLVPRTNPEPPCDVGNLERITAAAFGQRRKMLRSSLKQIAPEPEALLSSLGLDPQARAETLQIADFCRIANALAPR